MFDIDNYDIQYNTIPFIGTLGRKVTTVYTEPELMPLLMPKYETDLEVFVSELNSTKTGTIEETLFDYDKLQRSRKYLQRQYRFYGYGDQALIEIHNNNLNDGKRVLVVKESYADCMVPYLSNLAENISVIDPRHFDGSVVSYIEKNDPDAVIFVYSAGTFVDHGESKSKGFEFE